MTKTITLTNEAKVTAEGKHNTRNAKPVIKIDQYGRMTTYVSGIDAAKANGLDQSYLSQTIRAGKTYKGNKYVFASQLCENLDYINSKTRYIDEQQAKMAELEAKAAAYDNYIKAKQEHEAEIADTMELLAHTRQAIINHEVGLREMTAKATELEAKLEMLKAKEVTLA